MNVQKIAIAQCGGPTAVLNASLAGILSATMGESRKVYGVINGIEGLIKGNKVLLESRITPPLDHLAALPGAFLGAGRYPLTRTALSEVIERLFHDNIQKLVLCGGNGTMWACEQIRRASIEAGKELQVIGIPKTVDNDLLLTDHSPGFASAARYVSMAIQNIGIDLAAMRNFETVRVLETMGRNVGWLAAASSLWKHSQEDPPHLVYVPEVPVRREELLRQVDDVIREYGYCVIVVGEGIRDEKGNVLCKKIVNETDKFSDKVLGGSAQVVATWISESLGLNVRSENLGILQRAAHFAVSNVDKQEAYQIGSFVGREIVRNNAGDGKMAVIRRLSSNPYKIIFDWVPFSQVAGNERKLPSDFIPSNGHVSDSFRQWLKPLVGEDKLYPYTMNKPLALKEMI